MFAVACVFAFVFSFAVATKAQTTNTPNINNNFVLEPGKMEIFANPGDSLTRSITVTNKAASSVSFKVEVEDFTGSATQDMPVVLLGNEKSPYSFKDNLVPEITSFTLGAGEKITIPVKINVPYNAQPGGFYSSVLVSNAPSVDTTSGATGVEGKTKLISRVGTLFFVRVNGIAKESGSLDDVQVLKPTKDDANYKFNILFKNDGNVHLVPFGWVTVTNFSGKELAKLPVDAYFAMPQSIRYREILWAAPSLFGKYSVKVDLNRGYGSNLIDSKTVSFWVIPWGMIVGFIVVVLAIYFFFRKYKLAPKMQM